MDTHQVRVIKRGETFMVMAEGKVIVRTHDRKQAAQLARYLKKTWGREEVI